MITRQAKLSRFNGSPFPAWKIGKLGCAKTPARSLCALRASASCLTIGMGERLRRALGSATVLFHTEH